MFSPDEARNLLAIFVLFGVLDYVNAWRINEKLQKIEAFDQDAWKIAEANNLARQAAINNGISTLLSFGGVVCLARWLGIL